MQLATRLSVLSAHLSKRWLASRYVAAKTLSDQIRVCLWSGASLASIAIPLSPMSCYTSIPQFFVSHDVQLQDAKELVR